MAQTTDEANVNNPLCFSWKMRSRCGIGIAREKMEKRGSTQAMGCPGEEIAAIGKKSHERLSRGNLESVLFRSLLARSASKGRRLPSLARRANKQKANIHHSLDHHKFVAIEEHAAKCCQTVFLNKCRRKFCLVVSW